MTLQPPKVLWPDVQTVLPAFLRDSLAGREEPFTWGVRVGRRRLESWKTLPVVVVRRDGGMVRGVLDVARVAVRVWAASEDDATDLSLLVRSIMLGLPGIGPVVRVEHNSGPFDIATDGMEFETYMAFDVTLRGEVFPA